MKSIFLILVVLVILYIAYCLMKKTRINMDGFKNESWKQDSMDSYVSMYMNSHGSKSAGLMDILGRVQQQQNMNAAHVNPANKNGNPQNTMDEYKKHPLVN